MAHAEAVVGDGSGRPGYGRVEAYGPWPFGYVYFSGPAWEVESPDEEGEDELGSPPDEGARPPRPGGEP